MATSLSLTSNPSLISDPSMIAVDSSSTQVVPLSLTGITARIQDTSNSIMPSGSSSSARVAPMPSRVSIPGSQDIGERIPLFIRHNGISSGSLEDSGQMTYPDRSHYVGQLRNGMRNGQGTYTYLDSDGKEYVYEGEFKDDEMTGTGRLFNPTNKAIYEGKFENGKLVEGIIIYSNNTTVRGTFQNDKLNGKGTHTFPSGAVYNGDFANGLFHGKGTYNFHSGAVYNGDFVNGIFHGKGTYTLHNGEIYDGDFANGEFHGKGKKIRRDGEVYNDGQYRNGKFIDPNDSADSTDSDPDPIFCCIMQ